ncbi:M28 family peptidase [Siphonobacter sp. SORGH_AS_0500]|uniref:M28 family peptidase n=1 Tax=Siphonobacter sp. SORGH_AS_0500 TaxID=1864824 RepID=UPI0018E33F63|nr:M28 family peptidase [Siphonobacter sp. SORGH_AS_0500]
MSVTGEEQGLLGSEYYATHPVYPLSKTIANINLDILQPFGRMKDVIIVGKGQSDLDDIVEGAARRQGRFTRPEFNPAGGWYFRSDHFNFAKVGVPSMYLENGVVSIEHGEPGAGRKRKIIIPIITTNPPTSTILTGIYQVSLKTCDFCLTSAISSQPNPFTPAGKRIQSLKILPVNK